MIECEIVPDNQVAYFSGIGFVRGLNMEMEVAVLFGFPSVLRQQGQRLIGIVNFDAKGLMALFLQLARLPLKKENTFIDDADMCGDLLNFIQQMTLKKNCDSVFLRHSSQ